MFAGWQWWLCRNRAGIVRWRRALTIGPECLGDGDGDGVDDACEGPPPIPTVSAWGVVNMTLLVLTAGTVMFRRQRAVIGNASLRMRRQPH